MKAGINVLGVLVIEAENSTEYYALLLWKKNNFI